MSSITTITGHAEEPSWGRANPVRGAGYEDAARKFLVEFPIGSRLTADEFDEWAQAADLLPTPRDTDRKSDAWQAHLQRRHQLKYGINKAASHPRMQSDAFVVETIAMGLWEVRSPHFAISRNAMLSKIDSLINTKRKQLAYLMQSADWTVLPPHERAMAESLYDDIDMLKQRMELESEGLASKFRKLEFKLRKAVESGEVRPANGGIKAIIEGREIDDDAE
jgi:hypothetical protein